MPVFRDGGRIEKLYGCGRAEVVGSFPSVQFPDEFLFRVDLVGLRRDFVGIERLAPGVHPVVDQGVPIRKADGNLEAVDVLAREIGGGAFPDRCALGVDFADQLGGGDQGVAIGKTGCRPRSREGNRPEFLAVFISVIPYWCA